MTPNDHKITDVLVAIEAAAQERRRETLAHVARANRLTEDELRQIEDSARRAEMLGGIRPARSMPKTSCA